MPAFPEIPLVPTITLDGPILKIPTAVPPAGSITPLAPPVYTDQASEDSHVFTFIGNGNAVGDQNLLREVIGSVWHTVETKKGSYLKPNNLQILKTENLNGIEVLRAKSSSRFIRTVEINPCTTRIADSKLAVPNFLIPIRLYSSAEVPGGDVFWNTFFRGGQFGDTNFPGLLPSNKVYYDTMFKYTVPYSILEMKKSDIAKGESFPLNMTYAYNRFLRSYEEKTSGLSSELLIPNYYTYMHLKDADPDYVRYATFNDRMSAASVVDKLFSNDLASSIYLDKHFASAEHEETLKKSVINSQENIIFDNDYFEPQKGLGSIKKADIPKNLFPYYVKFTFPNDTGVTATGKSHFPVRDSIARNNFSAKFLEILKDVYDEQFPGISPTMSEYTVGKVCQTGSAIIGRPNIPGSVEYGEVSKKSYKSLDLLEFLTMIYNNYSSSLNDNYSFVGKKRASHGSTYSATGYDRYFNNKNTIKVIDEVVSYSNKILNLDEEKYLNLQNVINLQQNPVETVAYRLQKIGGKPTGDSNTENVLQNFWFFNSRGLSDREGNGVLDFVDTQVKYGQEYTYNLYAYVVVPTFQYRYSNLRLTKQIARIDTDGDGKVDEYCMQFYDARTMNFARQLFYDNLDRPTLTAPALPPGVIEAIPPAVIDSVPTAPGPITGTPILPLSPSGPGSGWGGGGGGGFSPGGTVPISPMIPSADGSYSTPGPGSFYDPMSASPMIPIGGGAPSSAGHGTMIRAVSHQPGTAYAMPVGAKPAAYNPKLGLFQAARFQAPKVLKGMTGNEISSLGGDGTSRPPIDWDNTETQQMGGGGPPPGGAGGVGYAATMTESGVVGRFGDTIIYANDDGSRTFYDVEEGKCYIESTAYHDSGGSGHRIYLDCCEDLIEERQPPWCEDGDPPVDLYDEPGFGPDGWYGPGNPSGLDGDFHPHVDGATPGDGSLGHWLGELNFAGTVPVVVDPHLSYDVNFGSYDPSYNGGSSYDGYRWTSTGTNAPIGSTVIYADGEYVGFGMHDSASGVTHWYDKDGNYMGSTEGAPGDATNSDFDWFYGDSDGGYDGGSGSPSDGGGDSGDSSGSSETEYSSEEQTEVGDDGGEEGEGSETSNLGDVDSDGDGIPDFLDPSPHGYNPDERPWAGESMVIDGSKFRDHLLYDPNNTHGILTDWPYTSGQGGPIHDYWEGIKHGPGGVGGVKDAVAGGYKIADGLGIIDAIIEGTFGSLSGDNSTYEYTPSYGSQTITDLNLGDWTIGITPGGVQVDGGGWAVQVGPGGINISGLLGGGKHKNPRPEVGINPPGTTSCVLAGTMIETERGRVPVEEITINDKAYSYDFEKEEYGYYDIVDVMTPSERSRWAMVTTTSGKSVRCTEEHPLYTLESDDNKLPVNEASIGDCVYVMIDGEITEDKIENIEYFDEKVMVYNFEVEEIHSYISDEILSHNKVVADDPDRGPGPGLPPTSPDGPAPGGPGTTQQMSHGGYGGGPALSRRAGTPHFSLIRNLMADPVTRALITMPLSGMSMSPYAGGGFSPEEVTPMGGSGGGTTFSPPSAGGIPPLSPVPLPPIGSILPDCRDSIISTRNPYATLQQDISDSPHLADVYMHVEPCFKLIEIPIYSKTQMVIDHPGNKASVYPFQYLDDSQKLGYEVSYESHVANTFPNVITIGDQLLKDNYLFANNKLPEDIIKSPSVSRARYIEVYRVKNAPTSFADFAGNLIKTIDLQIEDTDYVFADTIYEEEVRTNQKYYYLFRFLNEHFVICHPAEILECELVNDGGYKYAVFGVIYEQQLREPDPKNVSVSFKKLFQIEPNINQLLLDTENVDFNKAAHREINNVNVGKSEHLIWGKKFKIRLISKKTGRKLDLNVNFKLEEDPTPPVKSLPAGVGKKPYKPDSDITDGSKKDVYDKDDIHVLDPGDWIDHWSDHITFEPPTIDVILPPAGGPTWPGGFEPYEPIESGLPDGWSVEALPDYLVDLPDHSADTSYFSEVEFDPTPGVPVIDPSLGPTIVTDVLHPEWLPGSPESIAVVTDKFWWED